MEISNVFVLLMFILIVIDGQPTREKHKEKLNTHLKKHHHHHHHHTPRVGVRKDRISHILPLKPNVNLDSILDHAVNDVMDKIGIPPAHATAAETSRAKPVNARAGETKATSRMLEQDVGSLENNNLYSPEVGNYKPSDMQAGLMYTPIMWSQGDDSPTNLKETPPEEYPVIKAVSHQSREIAEVLEKERRRWKKAKNNVLIQSGVGLPIDPSNQRPHPDLPQAHHLPVITPSEEKQNEAYTQQHKSNYDLKVVRDKKNFDEVRLDEPFAHVMIDINSTDAREKVIKDLIEVIRVITQLQLGEPKDVMTTPAPVVDDRERLSHELKEKIKAVILQEQKDDKNKAMHEKIGVKYTNDGKDDVKILNRDDRIDVKVSGDAKITDELKNTEDLKEAKNVEEPKKHVRKVLEDKKTASSEVEDKKGEKEIAEEEIKEVEKVKPSDDEKEVISLEETAKEEKQNEEKEGAKNEDLDTKNEESKMKEVKNAQNEKEEAFDEKEELRKIRERNKALHMIRQQKNKHKLLDSFAYNHQNGGIYEMNNYADVYKQITENEQEFTKPAKEMHEDQPDEKNAGLKIDSLKKVEEKQDDEKMKNIEKAILERESQEDDRNNKEKNQTFIIRNGSKAYKILQMDVTSDGDDEQGVTKKSDSEKKIHQPEILPPSYAKHTEYHVFKKHKPGVVTEHNFKEASVGTEPNYLVTKKRAGDDAGNSYTVRHNNRIFRVTEILDNKEESGSSSRKNKTAENTQEPIPNLINITFNAGPSSTPPSVEVQQPTVVQTDMPSYEASIIKVPPSATANEGEPLTIKYANPSNEKPHYEMNPYTESMDRMGETIFHQSEASLKPGGNLELDNVPAQVYRELDKSRGWGDRESSPVEVRRPNRQFAAAARRRQLMRGVVEQQRFKNPYDPVVVRNLDAVVS